MNIRNFFSISSPWELRRTNRFCRYECKWNERTGTGKIALPANRAPRLLVFTWLPDWQEDATETIVRFDLEEQAGVTTVRLTHFGLESESSRASHKGWPQILTWLQAYVEQHA